MLTKLQIIILASMFFLTRQDRHAATHWSRICIRCQHHCSCSMYLTLHVFGIWWVYLHYTFGQGRAAICHSKQTDIKWSAKHGICHRNWELKWHSGKTGMLNKQISCKQQGRHNLIFRHYIHLATIRKWVWIFILAVDPTWRWKEKQETGEKQNSSS